MKQRINTEVRKARTRFFPHTNWITAALLTLVVTSFGIFASAHATETEFPAAALGQSISSHAMQLVACDSSINTTTY